MLEDEAADARLAAEALRDGGIRFTLKRVESGADFTHEVQHHAPDVIISDHALPAFDGLAALEIARNKCPDVPFIFFTGSLREEHILDTIKSGATDYVSKRRTADLVPAIRRALREQEERYRRQEVEEALRTSQEQVARWNVELEKRVAERTAQLEEANEELEAFSYSVSHDLRAPLRHIDGFVEILRSGAGARLDQESQDHLRTIAEAARHMGKLIDDLLLFSRMARAKMTTRKVSLASLIQDARRQLEPEAKGREVDWIIAPLPEVVGDPSLLKQALVNLLSNALKYTRMRPKTRIEIGVKPAKEEFIIFVRDNGAGFEMRFANKLFGVFQRLHRASEFEGTGIGLANIRRIIQRHGGRTWAEGRLNRGATFYFSLPKQRGKKANP
jgi:light-regulated signal transduction histidine kinase (bacteriophytochrome)